MISKVALLSPLFFTNFCLLQTQRSLHCMQASGAAQTMGLAGQVASADSDDEDEDELAGNGAAPASYTADAAKR